MRCPVCPHHCELRAEGPPGRCRARANRGGQSVPLNYGLATSLALDPIEKKPLYRFHPGSQILSVGSFGCNMDCFFCQNDSIACAGPGDIDTEHWPPQRLCDLAASLRPRGNIGVAFTYNEPLIGFEYILDTARLLRSRGLYTVAVTNGCFCPEAMGDLFNLVDAFNIDLKGFTRAWYRRLGGDLNTVQAFITRAAQSAHVELTALIVPGENDSEQEMAELSQWVAGLRADIPLHISRFFPRRNARDKLPTPRATIDRLCEVARKNLKYAYAGNM
ncbi:MAG: AmmeMemoRadiSam system radical SAM enzyme [Clostridiales bacterium]|nr:AmmeMemoRadiSam system radical SAM enzyme [Clostridiales bacterium]